MKQTTQKEFEDKIKVFYNNEILTKNSKYINSNTPLLLTCIKHNDFKIIPYKLFRNKISPCPYCKKEQLNIRVTNIDTFIKKSKLIHGEETYDYSKSIYKGNKYNISIICKEHGLFNIKTDEHLSSQRGCPICSSNNKKLNKNDLLKRFKELHKDKYIYPEFKYNNVSQNINIKCKEHGLFNQKITIHLNKHGCPKCGNNASNTEQFIKKANKIHNNKYDYSKVNYKLQLDPVIIRCKNHGEFLMKPNLHLHGRGCKKCFNINRNKIYLEKFKNKGTLIHNGKYNYDKSIYSGSNKKINILCPNHGLFKQNAGDHLSGYGCQSCASEKLNYSSSYEKEIIQFINNINKNIKINPNYFIENKEIDVYFPDFNFGVEVNGSYWHSHLFKDKKYHKLKSDLFKKHNIKIFHIWEHQWINPIKRKILESMILNKLKLNENKIYARKCIIKEINSKLYREFCENNHIQGHSPSKIKIGLYYNNELISVMGFGNLRINLGNKNKQTSKFELVRFCNKINTSVIGGASKLLKYFENNYKPSSIISYADNDYSDGNLYKTLGFEDKGFTNLSYIYYNPKDGNIKNRFCYRKSELIKLGYDKNLTEFEITHIMGLYRLYNSGIMKYTKPGL